MRILPLVSCVRVAALVLGLVLAGTPPAAASNGDLLATHTTLVGKRLGGLAADEDGTYWAAGETSGWIYHLDAGFGALADIRNPHPSSFPNVTLTRGLAFRPSTQTLLVLARNGSIYTIREVNRTGQEIPEGAYSLDAESLPAGASIFGFAHDSSSNLYYAVDAANDLVLRLSAAGTVLARFPYPRDVPPETRLHGVGISFLREGVVPYLYMTYGDVFTLAPSRVMELTVTGIPTGFEIPLAGMPAEDPESPLREVGAVLAARVGEKDAVVVAGRLGVLHVLERVRPSPIPPTFFTATLTLENQVQLRWTNNGGGGLGAYGGHIMIARDGLPLIILPGNKTDHLDTEPPAAESHTYTIRATELPGGVPSPPVQAHVIIGEGGLVSVTPFPGTEPYDVARNPQGGDHYVTDATEGVIYHLDRDLKPQGVITSPFAHPGGIAFNPTGNGGAGSLMVATTEGVLMQEIALDGTLVGFLVPVDFRPATEPRIGGLTYDAARELYTCVETSTARLVSFDRNGQQRAACSPVNIFTGDMHEGVGFDPITGNFHATFLDRKVRELYPNCTHTQFDFTLEALGETIVEPDFARGIEVIENHLIVCAPRANALFRLLIFPQGATFIRGDLNDDGRASISDAVYIAEYLFRKGAPPGCLDAGDTNDDGVLDISDPVYLLFHLFLAGPQPPPPHPERGTDPTYLDDLGCSPES